MLCVLSGAVAVTAGDRTLSAEERDLVTVAAGYALENRDSRPARVLVAATPPARRF